MYDLCSRRRLDQSLTMNLRSVIFFLMGITQMLLMTNCLKENLQYTLIQVNQEISIIRVEKFFLVIISSLEKFCNLERGSTILLLSHNVFVMRQQCFSS